MNRERVRLTAKFRSRKFKRMVDALSPIEVLRLIRAVRRSMQRKKKGKP